jgi:hypothetical protein
MDLYFPSPLHTTSWLASTETRLITLFLTSDLLFSYFISYPVADNFISQILHTLTETKAFISIKIANISAVNCMEVIPLYLLLQ